jgi:hypothetical protein
MMAVDVHFLLAANTGGPKRHGVGGGRRQKKKSVYGFE